MSTVNKAVSVYIPRKNKGDNERFVSVNGKALLIRTGETVNLPAEFAEVIEESIRADNESDRFIIENSEGR